MKVGAAFERKNGLGWTLSRPVWPDVAMKSSQIFSKVPQKVANTVFNYKLTLFKIGPKVAYNLGYFCEKNGLLDLSKLAQNGHTEFTTEQR